MRLLSLFSLLIAWGLLPPNGSGLIRQEPVVSISAVAEKGTSADMATQLALEDVSAGIVWREPSDSPGRNSTSPFVKWSMQRNFSPVRPGRTQLAEAATNMRQFAARIGAEFRESPVYRITDPAAVTCSEVLAKSLASAMKTTNASVGVGRAVASAWGIEPPGGLVGSCVSAIPHEGPQIDVPAGLTLADALDEIVQHYPGSVWVAAESADGTCSIGIIQPNENHDGTCSVEVPERLPNRGKI